MYLVYGKEQHEHTHNFPTRSLSFDNYYKSLLMFMSSDHHFYGILFVSRLEEGAKIILGSGTKF